MTILQARPLERRHMPDNYGISLARYTKHGTSEETRIPADFGPAQPLRGFEPTYRNIIDYIVRITYRIWEDRLVEYIRDTYHPESQVFDDYGLQLGSEKIVNDTHHTTGAFSDIQLLADEIIWAGDDDIGFHTSHRTIIRGTNDGASKYGLATNKKVDVWCIANCVALDNRIFLEHVLYNTSDLLLQLGFDLREMAEKMVRAKPPGWPRSPATWDALRSAAHPARPICVAEPVSGFDVDAFVREHFDRVWNGRRAIDYQCTHTPGVTFHGPSGRAAVGRDACADFSARLLETFPDLRHEVDEVYWMGTQQEGFLCSTRWSANGTHRGGSAYGPATHKSVQIWGITQHRIVDGRVVEEWTMFNELDLMMQLVARD